MAAMKRHVLERHDNKPFKGRDISISCHQSSDWLALVDGGPNGSNTVDIFDAEFNHKEHKALNFITPKWMLNLNNC